MQQKKQNDIFLEVEQIVLKDSKLCKNIRESYSRSQLESSEITIEGFCEHKWIWFRVRLEQDEECSLDISDQYIDSNYDKKNNVYKFKWKTEKYAGVFPVSIIITKDGENNPKKYHLQIDVLTKFGNREIFDNIMNVIKDACINPYRLSSPARISKDKKIRTYPIPLDQFFYILENDIIKKLERIIREISSNPYGEYIEERRKGVLDIVDNSTIRDMLSSKGDLIDVRDNEHISPEIKNVLLEHGIERISSETLTLRYATTYNIFENQLIETFFARIIACIGETEYILEFEKKEYEKQKKQIQKSLDVEKLAMKNRQIDYIEILLSKCKRYCKRVQNMKTYTFLDGVEETHHISRTSHVFQKDINYNRLYKILKKFIRTPKFYFSNSLGLTILDVPMAYEYWATLEMRKSLCEILQEGWEKTYDNMVKEFKYGCIIRFPYGKLLEFTRGNVKIYLFYHESYQRFTGGHYIPDISLEGTINGKLFETDIFDAKYTMNLDSGGEDNHRSPITIMHAIRDAIIGHIHKDPLIIEPGVQIVGSAFALFLGESKRKSVPNDPNSEAGGIKLFPDKDNINKKEIDNFIQNFVSRLLKKAENDN